MEELLLQLARQYQNKYYGKYRGFVADNDDPQQLGRLRVIVPSVLGEAETGWALPSFPFGGLADQGMFTVPEINAQVWVKFEEGNVNQPIWTGTFWQNSDDVPSEAAISPPTTRIFKTPAGHILQFDDKADMEKFRLSHPAGAEITIDKNGTMLLADAQDNTVTLDADAGTIVVEDTNGNTLTMSSSGTTVEDSNGNKIEMGPAGINVKGQQIVIEGTQVMLGGRGASRSSRGRVFSPSLPHTCIRAPWGRPVPQCHSEL